MSYLSANYKIMSIFGSLGLYCSITEHAYIVNLKVLFYKYKSIMKPWYMFAWLGIPIMYHVCIIWSISSIYNNIFTQKHVYTWYKNVHILYLTFLYHVQYEIKRKIKVF